MFFVNFFLLLLIINNINYYKYIIEKSGVTISANGVGIHKYTENILAPI